MFYLALAITILAGTFGNLLIKLGSSGLPSNPLAIIAQPKVLGGVLLLTLSFPFYSMVIQKLPLSVAFPLITSSTFVLVVLISYFFLKEPLTVPNFLGILLLIAGLFLVAQR